MPTDNLTAAVKQLRAISRTQHPYKFHRNADKIAETLVPMTHAIADFLEGTRFLFDENYLEARRFLAVVLGSLPRTELTNVENAEMTRLLLQDAISALREPDVPAAVTDDDDEEDTPPELIPA